MAHGIGDGELHGVAVDDVVEGVAADVRRRFQRSGDRELGRLACQRGGKEPVLDLGRQVQGPRAAAPLVDIGEGPVRDDDVGQGVRGRTDLPHRVFVGAIGEEELQQPDRVAAVGHGRHDPDRSGALPLHGRPLCAHHVPVEGAGQGDALGWLA